MPKKHRLGLLAVGTTLGLVVSGAAVADSIKGPTSSQTPYLVATQQGVSVTSLLSVGDVVGGYKMVGIPDGLGSYDNGDGTFTVLMNHEIGNTAGVTRAHGALGSFVSKWTINKTTLAVTKGEDLIKKVFIGDPATGTFTETPNVAFARLCSADLPAQSAFFDAATGAGTQTRIFMNGEETGAEGRAVATVVDGPDAGNAYVLPWLGKFSWENAVAMPNMGTKTVVVGTDDSTPGEIYVYVGTKQKTGNEVEKAGLVGGKLYGVKIASIPLETDATTLPDAGVDFTLVEIPDAKSLSGADLQTASSNLGITKFARPEDSAWDPTKAGRLYVAMTASFAGNSRLWNLQFDPANILAGGNATIAAESPADTTQGPRMVDNITVTPTGEVLMQEDPGNNPYVSGIFRYDPVAESAVRIALHDPKRFQPNVASPLITQDEESSGIIPAPFLGEGKYLADVQAHRATGDPETVEEGQLVLIDIKDLNVRDESGISATSAVVTLGQAGLVNVAVTPVSATGTVEIFNGATSLGTGSLSAGKASIALAPNSLPIGEHTLTAKYRGNAQVNPVEGSFKVTVKAAAVTPTVTATPTSTTTTTPAAAAVDSKAAITLSMTKVQVRKDIASVKVDISSASGTPTGVVSASVNGTAVSAAELASGTATLPLGQQSAVGSAEVKVHYFGSATHKAITSSPSILTVVKQSSSIAARKATRNGGKAVVPVTVKTSSLVATGKATIKVKVGKSVKKGSTKLVNGTALVTVKGLRKGRYKAVVSYSGDSLVDAATKKLKVRVG